MSFPILYTGAQSGVKIPEFDKLERAEAGFFDNIVKGAELQFKKGEEREADFMSSMKNDPVLLISDANRKRQAAALESYNNTYGALYAKRGGNLTMQDKIKQQSDREALAMTQDSMVADEKRFQAEKAVMDKDIKGFYDKKMFQEATKVFYETGRYPSSGLLAAPQEFVSRLQKMKGQGEQRTVRDKSGRTTDYVSNMSLDEAKQRVVGELMYNEGALRRAIEDFKMQPEKEIEKYFEDTNQNGIIDPAEKKSILDEPMNPDNPILKWAQDFYAPQIRTETPRASKNPPSGGGSGFSIGFGGKEIKYNPIEPIDTTIGDRTYKHWNYVRMTGDETNPQYPVSLNKATVLRNTGSGKLNRNTTIQDATLTGFGLSPKGDVEVTFLVPTDNWTKIGLGKGSELSVPLSEIPEYGEISVKYNGKLVKLKDLKGSAGGAPTNKPKLY